ncbi:acyl-CoA thioesterase [Cognatishimia maritima]|uniref:Thioesterase-like superfamily protein n=1 Tax=Cognatishimia maritima TaxID=870908 RepID=A0A1M5T3L4_9RHOB|nr:acyl-CoA thioesterase [Cognatishimia maritima]SHH45325.1 Thioesterase-like superfamily protein [Cognatishimia maritima]
MYPYLRMIWGWQRAKSLPELGIYDTHISTHRCWPQDIDMWMELNNGRTLTMYDLGRIPMAVRMGLMDTLKRERWGLTVAGSVVRYRRRILPFEKFEMRSRGLCWDDKFLYVEQSIWKMNGDCANHAVFRTAVTDAKGIVKPARVADAMGHHEASAAPPEWVAQWIKAEDIRPWPPMQDQPCFDQKAA